MPIINLTDGANITLEFNSGPLDGGTPAGNVNTLQYNANSVFGSVPFATYNSNGNLTLGSNSNIKITGGTSGQVISTDGAGNLSWVNAQPGVVTVDTVGSGLGFTLSNSVVGTTTTVQLGVPSDTTLRTQLNIGTVANVNLNNITTTWLRGDGTFANIPIPTGNIANTNYNNNINNFLRGDGTWTTVPAPSLVSNAVHSTQSDVANSIAGANVIGAVGLATLATSATSASVANSVAGGNVVGAVPLATSAISADNANSVQGGNVVGTVGSATVASVAAVANSIVGSNVVGAVSNAVHSTVSDSSNSVSGSNVVGAVAVATLASTATVANLVAGSNVSGAVSLATLATTATTATTALGVAGVNVSGTVANATHALTSNTVVNSSQPNITSVGTLTSLTSSGNISTVANIVSDRIIGVSGGVTITAAGVNQNITLDPSGTGVINASTSYIQNVRDPLNAQDAATKQYVDNVAQGLYVHETCLAGTTAPLSGVYNNGVSGVGATFTPTVALTSLDSVPLVNTDRVLLKNQTNTFENGIYTVTLGGTVLVRAGDADQISDFRGGDFVLVQSGTINSGTGWIQTSTVNTIGVDPILYQQFSAAGSYTAGTGLTLTGSQFSISPTTVVSGTYGNLTHVPSFTVNQQGQLTSVTNVPVQADASLLTGTTLSPTIVNSSLTSVGTLSSLNVTGNINLGTAINGGAGNFVTIDGKLVDGDQPNITNIGTLVDLSVQGTANLGNVGNLIIEGGAVGTVLTSLNGPVQWSNSLTIVNANVTNTANIKNLKVYGNANLGSNSNVVITGGNLGQVLVTNGFGQLFWDDILPNQAFQASIEFVAPINGTNQVFTHPDIGNFDDNTFASVYVNGVLMRVSQYDITNDDLTIFDYLAIGDEITVGSTLTGGIAEGTVRNITTATVDPDNLGFTLDTPGGAPITVFGTITLNVPPASTFAAAVLNKDYIFTGSTSPFSSVNQGVNGYVLFPNIIAQKSGSSITYNPATGIFTLAAGTVYRLVSKVQIYSPLTINTTQVKTITWVNASSDTQIYTNQETSIQNFSTSSTFMGGQGTVEIIFKPTVTTQVALRASGSPLILASSMAIIEQI